MAETDTSPAALRALAEYWADDKPAGVHGDDPDAIDAIVRETDAKMAETIAALLALAAEKEAGAPAPDAEPLRFTYRNYKGEVAERAVLPRSVRFGSTEWHPEPQWLMLAYDVDKQADREFAMRDMSPVARAPAPADWPVSASETARRILAILGKSDHPSLETGADERRDRIAALVERYAQSIVAERKVRVPAPAQGPLTEVGETSRGYKLYRAPNPVGGNTYWSDEIGGGVVVWDTCLVDEETLRLALAIEAGAPAPAAEGWIPWEGGECPVAAHTSVDVRFRGGDESRDVAGVWNWQHWNADIIAYRLSKEG